MKNEGVELLPSSLVTCLLDGKEVKILRISPEKLMVRVDAEVKDNIILKLAFYKFKENIYKEIIIKDYKIIKETKEKFFFTYLFMIDDKEYKEETQYIFKDYNKYVMLKNYGCDNEFSEEMVNYPAEKDYDFYSFFSDEKRELMLGLDYEHFEERNLSQVELAVSLDNDELYKKYLELNKEEFKEYYFIENYMENHKLFQKNISRIYIGNEVCHNLFPSIEILMDILQKAVNENMEITICFTYTRDCYIDKTKKIIQKVYDFCIRNNKEIEIVINDWGMIKLLKGKEDYFKSVLGVLLNKIKKDPRYKYKNGVKGNEKLMAENSLNNKEFVEFLKENKINRYEYESCGYRLKIAEGNHSIHFPFYVTNTSQYCTLYAMCKNKDRGRQCFVENCPKYCREYFFSYPKHLKMVGRYNSLFAFDDTLLRDTNELEYYIMSGIDRIVLNFI